jgi:phosphomannomutase/phosphoglucomutase
MGTNPPVTFGPQEMGRLREIVLGNASKARDGGGYAFVPNFAEAYLDDLSRGVMLERKLKVVCACGNGTAGAFAPHLLKRIGCEVIPLDVRA